MSSNILGGSIKHQRYNPDLEEEREKQAFDKEELKVFYFGQDILNELEYFTEDVNKNPELKSSFEYYDMSRQEKMEHWWKKYNVIARINRDKYLDKFQSSGQFQWSLIHIGVSPLQLHSTMFCKGLENLGSDEQVKEYLPQALALKIIGCYAQTEIGHGSNIADLETTATLDMETDEWVIHTPTVRATKFWPGSLGIMSNHALVFARAIAGENDFGP